MRNLEILLYGVYSDLQTEISRKLLGFLWWIIEPVLYMGTFYLVFGLAMNNRTPDYVPFLLTGMVAWKWFDGSVRLASSAISNNMGLIQQIDIPKILLILMPILSNTFKFFIILAILLIFLRIRGHHESWQLAYLLPVMLTQLVLIVALSVFLGSLVPFISDLKQVIDNFFMLLMFMSGIFFTVKDTQGFVAAAFDYNPVFRIISAYRDVLLYAGVPEWSNLIYPLAFSAPILLVGFVVLNKFERHYPKLTT
ncbi:similar to teichoic acid ABC transporter, permease subunit (TagG) [gamma proteobacterium HdN1]|nr:similar to teichoic acid ABC transporter, permease subunit (TagG) [gamma proteobacterium HdN1]